MRRYAAAVAAVTVAGGVALAALPVASASAVTPPSQTFVVPASGVFAITGHGWGHGHGMSQWGAEGAASRGVPASTIVSTYYPGTTASVLANTTDPGTPHRHQQLRPCRAPGHRAHGHRRRRPQARAHRSGNLLAHPR